MRLWLNLASVALGMAGPSSLSVAAGHKGLWLNTLAKTWLSYGYTLYVCFFCEPCGCNKRADIVSAIIRSVPPPLSPHWRVGGIFPSEGFGRHTPGLNGVDFIDFDVAGAANHYLVRVGVKEGRSGHRRPGKEGSLDQPFSSYDELSFKSFRR